MKKIFNLLLVVFLPLNLFAYISLEETKEMANNTDSPTLNVALSFKKDIISANLPCPCLKQLYSAIKHLDGSDLFKPYKDCVPENDESSDEESIIKELADHNYEELLEEYWKTINESQEVSQDCKDKLFSATYFKNFKQSK